MNIFPLGGYMPEGGINWEKSAQQLDNFRLHKMFVETCQLLCTSLHVLGVDPSAIPYKISHKNHPCALWARETKRNFFELSFLADSIRVECHHRFKNLEADGTRILTLNQIDDAERQIRHLLPGRGIDDATPLPMIMPDEFKGECVVDSYRRYFASKENIRYPEGKVPSWFIEMRTKPYKLMTSSGTITVTP